MVGDAGLLPTDVFIDMALSSGLSGRADSMTYTPGSTQIKLEFKQNVFFWKNKPGHRQPDNFTVTTSTVVMSANVWDRIVIFCTLAAYVSLQCDTRGIWVPWCSFEQLSNMQDFNKIKANRPEGAQLNLAPPIGLQNGEPYWDVLSTHWAQSAF